MTQTAYKTEYDKLFIGGKWVEPSTADVIEVHSPATGEYVGKVPLAAAALQFPLAHPAVASVIPGARSAAEITANIAHMVHPIPAALWAEMQEAGLVRADAPVPA